MNELNMNSNNINLNINNSINGETGKRLRLRRPNHSNEMIIGLNQSLTDECFTDATLICEDHSVRVHRIVLSLFSQYFRRTFVLISNTSHSCHNPVIAIKNIPYIDLKAIIEFIYCGEVSIPKEQLNSMLKSAEELEIEGLKSDNCRDFSTLNGIQSLNINNNTNSLPMSRMVSNNPIIASNLMPIPSQALEWSLNCSPKRKRVRKLNNKVLNTNQAFIPTNSFNIFNKNASNLSIVSLVPVSHNNVVNSQTIQTITPIENERHKRPVFVKNTYERQRKKSKVMSIASNISNTECVSQDLNNENASQIRKCNNSTNVSPVMRSSNTSNNCEGLNKLYEISNEDNGSDRKHFIDKLIAFHSSTGTPITCCPTINKQPLDLFKLYLVVKEKGGYEKVTKDGLWIHCTSACNVGQSDSACIALRMHYKKHLLAFECKYDRNGIDPNIILNLLETNQQNKETTEAQNGSETSISCNETQNNALDERQAESVVTNNAKQIEEIWLEDDEESEVALASHSRQQSDESFADEVILPNNLQTDQMEIENNDCIDSTPSTSNLNNCSNHSNNNNNSNNNSLDSLTIVKKGIRSQNYSISLSKPFGNESNSIKRNVKSSYPFLKCINCNKEFVNHLLYNLHVKNNCNKANASLLKPNINL